MQFEKTIDIWTDGGCSGNPGLGGIGVLMIYKDNIKKISGFAPYTTNNQMELLAVIVALSNIKESCNINLTTDSVYLKDGITKWIFNWKKNNWKTSSKQDVKNKQLWQKLDSLVNRHNVNFLWTKGHSGNPHNDAVDNLCTMAMRNKMPLLDNIYLELLNNDKNKTKLDL